MYDVERQVYDRFEEADRNMEEVRKLSQEEKAERLRELKRARKRRERSGRRYRDEEDEAVNIGIESRRRPAVEEWDRNMGTRTDLTYGKQHHAKAVGIGDLRAPREGVVQERDRILYNGKPVDIVCVDGSKSADKALLHAFKRLPRNHTFILLHGSYSPSTTALHPDENKEAQVLERNYLDLCQQQGRKCKFVNFAYASNRNFGEKVCQYEKYRNVESIVMGKRGYVSDFRRVLLGSSTQSVMDACSMPVTIVNEKVKEKQVE
jgi:hypothetical protein